MLKLPYIPLHKILLHGLLVLMLLKPFFLQQELRILHTFYDLL